MLLCSKEAKMRHSLTQDGYLFKNYPIFHVLAYYVPAYFLSTVIAHHVRALCASSLWSKWQVWQQSLNSRFLNDVFISGLFIEPKYWRIAKHSLCQNMSLWAKYALNELEKTSGCKHQENTNYILSSWHSIAFYFAVTGQVI